MDGLDPSHRRLFFSLLGGSGQIRCKACGHSESITCFEHGVSGEWSNIGLQCQTCGRFATLEEFGDGRKVEHFCNCPGKPTREDPLFCPACRSFSLDYSMTGIT